MFKSWLLPFRNEARQLARRAASHPLFSADHLQFAAVFASGLGLLVIWLWWLQTHSLI